MMMLMATRHSLMVPSGKRCRTTAKKYRLAIYPGCLGLGFCKSFQEMIKELDIEKVPENMSCEDFF